MITNPFVRFIKNAKQVVTLGWDSITGKPALVLASEKSAPNGVATLDPSGLIPSAQLPSFVDDVLEFANLAAFPATGASGKIYVALDDGRCYRWGGSTYTEVSSSTKAIFDLMNSDATPMVPSGYRDLFGDIVIKGTGSNDPTWTSFIGGIRAFQFSPSTMNESWVVFHIDHDYKPGGNIFLHVHWATTGTGVGTVRWGFEYTIAKGHSQGAASVFGATATEYVETAQSGLGYTHYVSELANSIPLAKIEPDSLILLRVFRDATHPNDTSTESAFVLKADAHYETDRIATLNRAPNFYQ